MEIDIMNKVKEFVYNKQKLAETFCKEATDRNDNPKCVLTVNALEILETFTEYCMFKFYTKYKTVIPSAEAGLVELPSIDLTEEFLKVLSVPVKTLIEQATITEPPLNCVLEEVVWQACKLSEANINLKLLKKHKRDIPNVDELIIDSENELEEICHSLNII
jgi:hypothetical protein